MGGLGGHVDHLYDNTDLSFTDMIKIMVAASNGEITGGEKLDGQNLFVSYSVKDGKAKAARNVGNVKKGGMDAEALAAKFAGRGTLEAAFNGAFEAFVDAVQQMPDDVKLKVFGPDANIFYNAEVMDPDNPNIINYNSKKLIIHRDGHGEYDRETGQVTDRDVSAEAGMLGNALKAVEKSDREGAFGVEMKAVERLRALDNDTALTTAKSRLEKLLSDSGVGKGSTVGEYIVTKLDSLIERLFPDLDDDTKKLIMERMFGVKGVTATQIYKKITDPSVKDSVRNFIRDQKRVRKEIIFPLEDIVHDFAVEMLDGLKSRFVLSHKDEINRIADRVEQAIAEIESEADEVKLKKLKDNLGKLKSLDKISSSMEGFVFAYNGHTYKLTGSFAPVNQIMSLLPWEKKQGGNISENTENQEVFSIFPGKFKPPHSGHFLGAKEMIDSYGVDKVFIVISKKKIERQSGEGKIKITPEVSRQIWEKYISENGYDGKIIPLISTNPTPIVDTFEMLSSFKPGTVVLFSKGEKDVNDRRFDTIYSYIEKNNLQITAKQVPGSMSDTGASGTLLGNAIASKDLQTFKKMVPLSGASAMELWEELMSQVIDVNSDYPDDENEEITSEVLFEMIDEAINIDDNPVPGGQLGGPQRTGEESASDDDTEQQKSNKKGGESNTEVEVTTKTVVNVSVNGNDVKVTTNDDTIGDENNNIEEVVNEDSEQPAERGIINLDNGLRLNRSELPQIKSTEVPEFIDWMKEKGVDSFRTSVKAGSLNPIQLEINLDKVDGMKAVHQSGQKDMGAKPVMVSNDDYLIDGHHRWYALKELGEDINVVMFNEPIDELLSLIKQFPKTTYKGVTDEGNEVITESYGKVDGGGPNVVNVGKMKIVIDVEDMDLEPSKHGEERRFRHGAGKTISKDAILQAAQRGLGLVIQDYANGEVANGEAFVIRHKANARTPALNIVAALEMRKGPDTMKIITVMRKDDFKTDNFGGGQQKTYNV